MGKLRFTIIHIICLDKHHLPYKPNPQLPETLYPSQGAPILLMENRLILRPKLYMLGEAALYRTAYNVFWRRSTHIQIIRNHADRLSLVQWRMTSTNWKYCMSPREPLAIIGSWVRYYCQYYTGAKPLPYIMLKRFNNTKFERRINVINWNRV